MRPLLLALLLTSCIKEIEPPIDSGTSTRDVDESADICEGVPNGTVCNYGFASDYPPECCTADETCCPAGFEHDSCYSGSQCPKLCTNGNFFYPHSCPRDKLCFYQELNPPPSEPPPEPEQCTNFDTTCVDTCPTEQQCGGECCGPGLECQNGTCCRPA